jgi:hypothetical protein
VWKESNHPEAAVRTWKTEARGLETAQSREHRSSDLPQEAGADFAIDLHPAEPVKGCVGDAYPLQCQGGSDAGRFVALPAYRLPRVEALADCWIPSGCDLWSVLVVDCGLRLDVYSELTAEVEGVKRLEGGEQVAEAQKRHAAAARR